METVFGMVLGAIIVVGALAWSSRHPSSHAPRSEPSQGREGAEVYGGWSCDHHTGHGGFSDDGSSGL
jgi:hypothetical protein